MQVKKMNCKAMFILEEGNQNNYLPQQSKRAALSLEMGIRVSGPKGLLQNLREMQVLRAPGLFLAWLSTAAHWYRAGSQTGEARSASRHACQDKEEGGALLWEAAGLSSWGAATKLVVRRRDKGSHVGPCLLEERLLSPSWMGRAMASPLQRCGRAEAAPAGAGHELCAAATGTPLPAAGPGCSALTAFPVPLPRSSTGCVWHFSDRGGGKWDRKSLGVTVLHQQRGKTGTETIGDFFLKGQDARSGPANLHLLK